MGTAELLILKKEATKAEVKMNVESQFTKRRWILTVIGLILYAADIVLDIILGLKYLKNGHLVWGILTLVFILCASVCTQIFSYMWFRDDRPKASDGTKEPLHRFITGLHLTHMGIFTRYSQLLIDSFKVVWCTEHGNNHFELFGQATDLSMLRLFEAFLESVPQLLLQLYIFILRHGHTSVIHYLAMAASFFNIAWAVVDYRRCLRRSLPDLKEMSIWSTIVYLLYKLFAISTRVFSLSLLLVLSPFSILYLALVWFLSTAWAFFQKTDFCTSKALEILYRAIVGIILVFTFFNITGEGTNDHMAIYYIFYVLQSISAPLFLWMWKPEVLRYEYSTAIIIAGLSIGLGLLCVYYALFHKGGRKADEVDNMPTLEHEPEPVISPRMKKFLRI